MYLLDLPGPSLFKGQFCMKGCVWNKVLSDHGRISSVGKALDCTADFGGRIITQGVKYLRNESKVLPLPCKWLDLCVALMAT